MVGVFTFKKRVDFFETDMAGIVHYSNFFRYVEMAEAAFYRQLGITLHDAKRSWALPRVKVESEFLNYATFEDEIEITLWVTRVGNSSVEYAFCITKNKDDATVEVTRGSMVVVCVHVDPVYGTRRASTLPDSLRNAL